MAGFGSKLKGALNSAREKVNDNKLMSPIKNADLLSAYSANQLVFGQFKIALGREDWWLPKAGETEAEQKEEVTALLERIWGEDYDPQFTRGSVASTFNFTILYLVCLLDIPSDKDKFMKSLNWAMQESSIENIYDFFGFFIIFGDADSMIEGSLKEYLPNYVSKNFPGTSIDSILEEVDEKYARYEELQGDGEESEYFTTLVANMNIVDLEAGSEPRIEGSRYLEDYAPERMGEKFIKYLVYLGKSLKPDTSEKYLHIWFCEDGILICNSINNGIPPHWISRDEINSFVFGLAYDALSVNGVNSYESYKLFMYSNFKGNQPGILYKYLGDSREKAFIEVQAIKNDLLIPISEYYDVEWTDEVIDESSHYTRTTTTTTTTTFFSW